MSYLGKYVGRVFSNFIDLYHGMGINSATLTGAIDVIIIEQADGTFTCSPFHVRFGKLGVLRSREKVVDIEINNEPVDLHMKLGEAGEAFFVQELGPESQIPEYLATSPLPSSDELMKEGVKELRRQSSIDVCSDHSASTVTATTHSAVNGSDPQMADATVSCGRAKKLVERETASLHNESTSKARRRKKRRTLRASNHKPKHLNPEIFVMDVTTDEEEPVDDKLSLSMPALPRSTPPTDEECRMKRTHKWAQSQFEGGIHAFSDSEAIPEINPESRLYSPASDSEIDRFRSNDTSADMATCDEETLWEWGELPKTPDAASGSFMGRMELIKEPPHVTSPIADTKSSMSPESKPATKTTQRLPKEEGLYLDDLMRDEMDPEIAKLYFPKSSYQFQSIRDREEDTESGRGASLPQSPHSVEGAIGGPPVTYLRSEVQGLGIVSMSLCGGLAHGNPKMETFMQKIVTYDELSSNPGLINSPDLVLRIEDKFYNWNTAAPIILSQTVFNKELTEETIQSLIKDHMPKKRKSVVSSWFSWRRAVTEATTNETSSTTSPTVTETTSSLRPTTQESNLQEIPDKIKTEPGRVMSAPSSLSSSPRKVRHLTDNRLAIRRDEEPVASDPDTDCSDRVMALHVANDGKVYQKTLRLTADQITELGLKAGQNTATFSVTTQYQGTTRCMSHIYLWKCSDKVVISDIDGTITKSDVLGQILPILPIVGRDWSQSGVTELYSRIHKNGYKFMYLSARAIGQSRSTKDMLKNIKQDNVVLPDGPILLSPTSLIRAFTREVIDKKPEVFKIQCLSDIADLFPHNVQPFYAGFGNKINDVYAYRALSIPQSHIFTINYSGEVRHEKILTFQSSYYEMCDTVDHFFPPLAHDHHDDYVARDFTSASFWRDPIPDIDPSDLLPSIEATTARKDVEKDKQ